MKDEEFNDMFEFTTKLIKKAEEGKIPDYVFIEDVEMLDKVIRFRRSSKKLYRLFKKSLKSHFKTYYRTLKNHYACDLEELITYKANLKWAEYYRNLFIYYDDILYEFKRYAEIHPIICLDIIFFGRTRPEEDLKDFSNRGLATHGKRDLDEFI